MGMLNNTKIKVTYPLEELLQIAYKQLAIQDLVPYTQKSAVPTDYQARYHLKNAEGKIFTNVDELSVTFGLIPKEKEEEKPYEAGDWRDPEVDKIIDESSGREETDG